MDKGSGDEGKKWREKGVMDRGRYSGGDEVKKWKGIKEWENMECRECVGDYERKGKFKSKKEKWMVAEKKWQRELKRNMTNGSMWSYKCV